MIAPRMRPSEGFCIYLFHGVIPQKTIGLRNYNRKHIDVVTFRRRLNELTNVGPSVSMDEIINARRTGESLPPGAFAVTFDDGFENNYSIAAPILHELRIPATFYVTTSFIERNLMSWIDQIEYCLSRATRPAISLPWSEARWRAQTTGQKIDLLEEIRAVVKSSPKIDPEVVVDGVFEQCNVDRVWGSSDTLDQKMSWSQVRSLAEDPLFTIGGHSHTHRTMAFLNASELAGEIDMSLELIRRRVGEQPRHYSYPEGMACSYSPDVIRELQRRGVVCCPSAEPGSNQIGDDLFHLKRIPVTE